MSNIEIFITIVVITAATMLTRFLPFLIFPQGKKTPDFVTFLGEVLPYAMISLLVVYCLRNVHFQQLSTFLPELLSVSFIVLLHTWKKNTLLSIGGGTILYMFLVQMIF